MKYTHVLTRQNLNMTTSQSCQDGNALLGIVTPPKGRHTSAGITVTIAFQKGALV
jgi:hypothetical protein